MSSVELAITGFGSTLDRKSYDLVELCIVADNENIIVQALVVDELPNNVRMPGYSNAVIKLKSMGYKLADPVDSSDAFSDISILIGADEYFKFLSEPGAMISCTSFLRN